MIEDAWKTEFQGNPLYILLKNLKGINHILTRWRYENFNAVSSCISSLRKGGQHQQVVQDNPTDQFCQGAKGTQIITEYESKATDSDVGMGCGDVFRCQII